jgi:hypothetical protein
MTAVHFDRTMEDGTRRSLLYAGDLFVYSPTASSLALVALARELLDEGFGGRDPQLAQYDYDVAAYAQILARLKPAFIHHPECKRLIPGLLAELGCDTDLTYFDVPRLRTSTSDDYLTTGIAYAFHPHRDTWYSAPMCQINWWLPVYELEAGNAMAFHPRFHAQAVRNDSYVYDYQEWNAKHRFGAAGQVGKDTRTQPRATEPLDLEPSLVLLPPVGGIIGFSANQLHSSIPNRTGRTRLSIDFRTVHAGDAGRLAGATNVDACSTGSTMDDYLRCGDLSHLPEDVQRLYRAGHPQPPSLAPAKDRA